MQRNTIIDCNLPFVYWGLGQELNHQQAMNKHLQWRAAFIPQWRDITGCREASHTIVSAIWQNFLPIQRCVVYLEKLLPLAIINGNLDKEQVFHSGWGAFKKGQISLRKLLKYWHMPVFNLPWFGKGSQLQWNSACLTESLFYKMLFLRLSPMCHSWLGKHSNAKLSSSSRRELYNWTCPLDKRTRHP